MLSNNPLPWLHHQSSTETTNETKPTIFMTYEEDMEEKN